MTTLPDPDIVEVEPKRLAGVAQAYTLETRGEIPSLYKKFFEIEGELEAVVERVLYGVSMDTRPDGRFRYGVGFEVSREIDLPEGACFMALGGGAYAVFSLDILPSDLPRHFDTIFSDWLPGSSFRLREGAVFERYGSEPDPRTGAMTVEVWVPVTA